MNTTKVAENLWVGSVTPIGPSAVTWRQFDVMLLTAAEYQPHEQQFPGVRVLHLPLFDSNIEANDQTRLIQAGRAVASLRRRGKKVLVSSLMGLNRACAVAGVALMSSGLSADEAIKALRAARGEKALCNPQFVRILQQLEAARQYLPVAV